MFFNCKAITALAAVSACILSASAGPVERRDTTSTTASAQPTAALLVTTDADGKPTTIDIALPSVLQGSGTSTIASDATTITGTATATSSNTAATSTPSEPSSTLIPSGDFPACHDTNAHPFCLPNDNETLYVGKTYYVTWNPDFFKSNSTITVKLNYANSSQMQAWSSDAINVAWGVTTIEMEKEWLQDYTYYNLTFFALVYEGDDTKATAYDGPNIMLKNAPADHYQPPPPTKAPNKESLTIALPVSLGFIALVLVGLCIGMRSRRNIGLGNIMGRRKGYDSGKSRRQRLGLGKKGAIRLQDREIRNDADAAVYTDEPDTISPAPPRRDYHVREPSLGSLVSDDERPRGNACRSEIERQRTGR